MTFVLPPLRIAVFPEQLLKPYISSLCPPDGIVLDPFIGSGTTMLVSAMRGRSCIGIELKPEYIEYTKQRLDWGRRLGIDYEAP